MNKTVLKKDMGILFFIRHLSTFKCLKIEGGSLNNKKINISIL